MTASFRISSPPSTAVEVFVSPTSMGNFFACPEEFRLSRLFTLIEDDDAEVNFGTSVHRVLAEERAPGPDDHKSAAMLIDKLLTGFHHLKLSVLEREVHQSFALTPAIHFTRIIDAVCKKGKYLELVDWKTAGKPWETVMAGEDREVSPQSMGFQAAGYLIPPPGVKEWAETIHFVVASFKGAPQVFSYERNEEGERNFLEAAEFIRRNYDPARAVKVRGKECFWCNFQALCYGVEGCEQHYTARPVHNSGDLR